MKAFKRPEDRVIKENVYLTGADSAKIKEKYGSLTAALRQMLFDIAVQDKVEEITGAKPRIIEQAKPLLEKTSEAFLKLQAKSVKEGVPMEKIVKDLTKTKKPALNSFMENRRKLKNKEKE